LCSAPLPAAELPGELTDGLVLVEGAELGVQDCLGAWPPLADRGRFRDGDLHLGGRIFGGSVFVGSGDILVVFLPSLVMELDETLGRTVVAAHGRAFPAAAFRADERR